ncbi:MAG: DUF357 domain-containing protein [Candidatus Diapherotrites archaeon]|uniref:DUF357 domain-containing protein n=1 Tax=Candidatus Iainarchaeum sp. TaxID=3101447 RepID=A0A8T4LGF2_9ARCH|nr:DUF357 domain-containing protein [Candidatus Diapherotrites archaeon]
MNETLRHKTKKYRLLTEEALRVIQVSKPLSTKEKKIAADFLQMTRNYFSDGQHFEHQKEFATALAAYSYAHAWLDAGVRAGLFDAKGNDRLFTLQ